MLALALNACASTGSLLEVASVNTGNADALPAPTQFVETASNAVEPYTSVATEIPVINTPTSIPAPILGIGSTLVGVDGMTLLYVPSGDFLMGSTYDDVMGAVDERPQHIVTLDAYWIDQTEVTNAMYAKCVAAGVCREPLDKSSYTRTSYYGNSEFENYPVIYVDWNMANVYCGWAGRRLPSEAEWEKAARGLSGSMYPWGNDTPNANLLNYKMNIGDTTQVGIYLAGQSMYGAFDMAGNVWEWVNDWHSETYYPNSPISNPFGPEQGQDRVLRGGSWLNNGYDIRTTNRNEKASTDSFNVLGFRCSLTP